MKEEKCCWSFQQIPWKAHILDDGSSVATSVRPNMRVKKISRFVHFTACVVCLWIVDNFSDNPLTICILLALSEYCKKWLRRHRYRGIDSFLLQKWNARIRRRKTKKGVEGECDHRLFGQCERYFRFCVFNGTLTISPRSQYPCACKIYCFFFFVSWFASLSHCVYSVFMFEAL